MGPPDQKPDFPVYDSIEVPGNKIYAFSNWLPCNWLQVHENVADQAHITVFHNGVGNRALMEGAAADSTQTSLPQAFGAESPVVENRVTDDGRSMVIITTRRVGDKIWVRNNQFMVPNYLEIAGVFEDLDSQKYFAGASHVRWNVPHDDDSCSVFAWRYFNKESDPKGKGDASQLGVEGGDFLEGLTGARPRAQRHRYPGDWDVLVGQRAIAVHGKENLAPSDQGVALWRKICRDALRDTTQRNWPKTGNGGEAHFNACVNDTVFFIPRLAGADEDWELLRHVGRRVTDIITEEALSPGKDRKREIAFSAGGLRQRFGKPGSVRNERAETSGFRSHSASPSSVNGFCRNILISHNHGFREGLRASFTGLVFCPPAEHREPMSGLAIPFSMWQCAGHGDAAGPGFVR